MSTLIKFNPQSQSFVSQGAGGKFENRPFSCQGIVKNTPAQYPGPKVLSAGKWATQQLQILS